MHTYDYTTFSWPHMFRLLAPPLLSNIHPWFQEHKNYKPYRSKLIHGHWKKALTHWWYTIQETASKYCSYLKQLVGWWPDGAQIVVQVSCSTCWSFDRICYMIGHLASMHLVDKVSTLSPPLRATWTWGWRSRAFSSCIVNWTWMCTTQVATWHCQFIKNRHWEGERSGWTNRPNKSAAQEG